MPRTAALTADELFDLSLPNKSVELVRGRLIVREPPGFLHGVVAGELFAAIDSFVRPRRLGIVLAAETGFKLFTNPDTVRAADVAFVHRDRVPDPLPDGYADFAPDLVVEVRSPRDRAGKIAEKIADWLAAGAKLVWFVDPRARRVRVHRADGSEATLDANGTLDGEEVLPGFTLSLSPILR